MALNSIPNDTSTQHSFGEKSLPISDSQVLLNRKNYSVSKSDTNIGIEPLAPNLAKGNSESDLLDDWVVCAGNEETIFDTQVATITEQKLKPDAIVSSDIDEDLNYSDAETKEASRRVCDDSVALKEKVSQKEKSIPFHTESPETEVKLQPKKAYSNTGLNCEELEKISTIKEKLCFIKDHSISKNTLLVELKKIVKTHIPTFAAIDVNERDNDQKLLKKIASQLHPDRYRTSEEATSIAEFCFKEFISLYEQATTEEAENSISVDSEGLYFHQQVPDRDIIDIYKEAFSPQKIDDISESGFSATSPTTTLLYQHDSHLQKWLEGFDTFYTNINTRSEVKWLISTKITTIEELNSFSEAQWKCFYIALKQNDNISYGESQQCNGVSLKSICLDVNENFHCFEHFLIHWLICCNKPEVLEKLLINQNKIPSDYKKKQSTRYECRGDIRRAQETQARLNCVSYCIYRQGRVESRNFHQCLDNETEKVTPLMRACSLNNIECALILIKHKAPVDYLIKSRRGCIGVSYTAIHLVKSPEMLMRLIDEGVDLNVVNADGQSFLHFIAAGKEPSLYNSEENNLRRMANTTFNYESLVAKLNSAGVDIGLQDKDGNTPFHLACSKGHVSFVFDTLLTTSQKPIHKQITYEKAEFGSPSMPESKAVVTEKDQSEQGGSITQLYRSQHRWLLERRNHNGEQPIHLAVKNKNFRVIKVLAAAGCNFNTRDKDGNLPIQSSMHKVLTANIRNNIERREHANMAFWLIRHMVKADSEKFFEVMEELIIDPMKIDEYSQGISIDQIKNRFQLFFQRARGEVLSKSDEVPKECELKIKLTEHDEQRLSDFADLTDICMRLVNSADTESEKIRLSKMLAVCPAGSSAFDMVEPADTEPKTTGLSEALAVYPTVSSVLDKRAEANMASNSGMHPTQHAKKGVISSFFYSKSRFDENLSELAQLPKEKVMHWLYRFNCRKEHRLTQGRLNAGANQAHQAIRGSSDPKAIEWR